MNKLTESTLLPLSLVLTIIGGATWMTKIYFTSEAAAAQVDKIERKYETFSDAVIIKLESINDRLARIEERLKKERD
jgi:hypothetical protein